MANEQNETIKPKWHNAKKVEVNKVVLELFGKNDEFVKRIRLETNIGNITYKPKKIVTKSSNLDVFDTENTQTEMYKTSEFVTSNKMLTELAKNCKKEPQEVVLSYAEISRIDEEDEEIFYKYMMRNQFETIYYEKFHKSDKSNLDAQEERAKKYSEQEL